MRTVFITLLVCAGLHACNGDDAFTLSYDNSGLATDEELQCTDNYCCNYDDNLQSKCPLSSLPDSGPSMIFPGGNTRCLKSYSTPYAFQVHKGAKDKVLFYFQGGGSCWNEETTNSSGRGKTGGTYCRTDAVPWAIYGVFDKTDQRNSYRDYTIVNVLYCSGDNHAGNAERSYVDEDGKHIVQRGAINTESVIQWVQAQQLNGGLAVKLEDFVIMGCSAGALASQIWGNELVHRFNYPHRTAIVADSYLGVFPGDGSVEGEIIYNLGICSLNFMTSEFRQTCEAKQATTADFVTSAMRKQPNLPYIFLQSRYDRVQVKYYNFLAEEYGYDEIDGGGFEELADAMVQEYNSYSNFIAYFVDSNQHCYTPTPYMYFADTGGLNGYETDDDEMGGGRDDDGQIDVDLYAETMNRFLTRVPLSTGDSISSQCADEDCTTYGFIPKTFLQPELERGDNEGEYIAGVVDYTPSTQVRAMHQLPHYDSNLKRVSSEFNISLTSDPWNGYAQSIMPLPIIIYLVGVFLVVVFQFYLIFRRAMGYNPYAQANSFDEEDDEASDGSERVLHEKKRGPIPPSTKMTCFRVLLMTAFVLNFLIFAGDVYLEKGTVTADRAVGRIDKTMLSVASISDDLMTSGANVTALFNTMGSLGCEDADKLADYSMEFESVIDEISGSMDPIEPYVSKSNHILDYWVKERKNHFIWVTFSLNTLCIMFFGWAFDRKSALGLQLTLVLTEVVVLLNMIFGVLFMMSLMGASDFCMNPKDYVLAMTPVGSTRETLEYYATCSGISPTTDFVTDSAYNINVMQYFVSYVGTSSCPDLSYLANQVQWNLDQIHAKFEIITEISSCDTYMPYWEDFLYDGVCSYAFDGMYLIWITQSLCAICLLLAAMLSSSIFPYFIELKKLGFESDMMSSHGQSSSVHSSDSEGIMSSLSSGTARMNPMVVPWEIERRI